jgi:hypothetical protein
MIKAQSSRTVFAIFLKVTWFDVGLTSSSDLSSRMCTEEVKHVTMLCCIWTKIVISFVQSGTKR